jgi:hypothetical protein
MLDFNTFLVRNGYNHIQARVSIQESSKYTKYYQHSNGEASSLECRPAQNVCAEQTLHARSLNTVKRCSATLFLKVDYIIFTLPI